MISKKKNLVTLVSLAMLGATALSFSPVSFAHHGWHHHGHHHGRHHHYYRHHHDDFVPGLIFGAALGAITTGAIISSHNNRGCYREVVKRYRYCNVDYHGYRYCNTRNVYRMVCD